MAERGLAFFAVQDTLDEVVGDPIPHVGTLGQFDSDVLWCAAHGAVQGQWRQLRSSLGGEQFDLNGTVGLVARLLRPIAARPLLSVPVA
jgi:hypothetical protein